MQKAARRTAILAGIALTIAGVGAAPVTVAQPAGTPARVAEPAAAPATVASSADAAARSGDRRRVRVAGRQLPVDLDNGLYEMRGSLIGDWRYVPEIVLHDTPTLYVESGVEIFDGCIDRRPRDGRCTRRDHGGTMHLTFLYWASFDRSGDLLKGRCVHPVTGGTGDFAGARGLLRMFDRPVGNEVRTTYRGRVVLNAVPREGDAPAPAASGSAGTAADQATSAISARSGC